MGTPATRILPIVECSITGFMSIAVTCGCVKNSSHESTGAHGTPAASSAASHSADVLVLKHGINSAFNSAETCVRCPLLRYRGSVANSGIPTIEQIDRQN